MINLNARSSSQKGRVFRPGGCGAYPKTVHSKPSLFWLTLASEDGSLAPFCQVRQTHAVGTLRGFLGLTGRSGVGYEVCQLLPRTIGWFISHQPSVPSLGVWRTSCTASRGMQNFMSFRSRPARIEAQIGRVSRWWGVRVPGEVRRLAFRSPPKPPHPALSDGLTHRSSVCHVPPTWGLGRPITANFPRAHSA